MTKYGALAAKIYDPLLAKTLSNIRKRVYLEAKRLGISKIIDLCCGTGHQLWYFVQDDSFQEVVGIDLSPHMVKQSEKYGVKCLVQDATRTSFSDSEFDAAMVSFALHEKPFELARSIVQEALRLTKPGGYFLVVDYVYDERTSAKGRFSTWLVEFLVGGEHYRNFRRYLSQGGLPELTRDLQLIKDLRFVEGAVALQIFQV